MTEPTPDQPGDVPPMTPPTSPPPPPPPPGAAGVGPESPPVAPVSGQEPITGPPAATPPWASPGAPVGPPTTGPPPPVEEPPTSARNPAVVALAVIAVVALVAGLVSVVFRGDDDGSAEATGLVEEPAPSTAPTTLDPGPDSTDTTPTSSTTLAPGAEAEFLALVDELKAYVSDARGLPFLRSVVVELADDAEFEQRLLDNFEDDDVAELNDAEVFYRALGLLDTDETLVDLVRGLIASGVVGYYNTEDDELVLRGSDPSSAYLRQTIVHELVHALDDQHFELFRPEYDDRKDEIGSGLSAIVEGNASRIENRWLADQPREVREAARDEARTASENAGFDDFPEILVFELSAPYQLGPVLVGEIVAGGGERGVDAALNDPPTTSEQVLFPDRYTEREPRLEVPPPPADGPIVDDGVVGASFLFGLLTTGDSTVNPSDAVRAVDGWGGDWAVTWRDGDANCVRIDVVGDTAGDTDELEDVLSAWAEDGAGQVSRTDVGLVRLESCVVPVGATPPQV